MKLLTLIFLLIGIPLASQQLYNFEDRDMEEWNQLPESRWGIDTISAISGEASLHHIFDNPSSGVDLIFRENDYPSLSDTICFTFSVRHAYAPSSSNNWQVFFLSSILTEGEKPSVTNGFIFGVNYIGSDDIVRLWQTIGGETEAIITTNINYQDSISTSDIVDFKIERIPNGLWLLYYRNHNNDGIWKFVGSASEIRPLEEKYIGLRYSYSSSQDRKLWFDDLIVEGVFYRDTISPSVIAEKFDRPNTIVISFSEEILPPHEHNFSVRGSHPELVEYEHSQVTLSYADDFQNRENTEITALGIHDREGNLMNDTTLSLMLNLPEFGDVVINEIMADPVPPVYLPECEYVELFNRYSSAFDLNGFQLYLNEKKYKIINQTMEPGGYLILSSADCMDGFLASPAADLLGKGSALPNNGGEMILLDSFDRIIHRLKYTTRVVEDIKNEGGWSLERIDPDAFCSGMKNWKFSENPLGGTPGMINSVDAKLPDNDAPFPLYIGVPSPNLISVFFDEQLVFGNDDAPTFKLNGYPLQVRKKYDLFAGETVELISQDTLLPHRKYTLNMELIQDCRRNLMQKSMIQFMLPEKPETGEIIMNEVMYDPIQGTSEYIELFNNGDSYIDFKDLKLNISTDNDQTFKSTFISEHSVLLPPGEYVVFCRDPTLLRKEWDLGTDVMVLSPQSWMALDNTESCIQVADRSGKILEQFCYHDSLHQDYLNVTTGVSLERICHNTCFTNTNCWTSASSFHGYGTPGKINSQFAVNKDDAGEWSVEPAVFSPDNDGYEDLCTISFKKAREVSNMEVYVTDLHGRVVNILVSNGIPGYENILLWNGEDDTGKLVDPGIFIIHCRWGSRGRIQKFRKPVAVMYR